MPQDRFLIAPLTDGLQNNVASYAYSSYNLNYTKGSIMSTRKNRADSIDLLGQKFGRLTVTDRAPREVNKRGAVWQCLCECGKTTRAFGGKLRNGGRISCGCAQLPDPENTGIRNLMSIYFTKARKRNRLFLLTFEEFKKLVTSNCNYCNIEPKQPFKRQKHNEIALLYNGLDRVDTNGNYDIVNSVPCCFVCNKSKGTMNVEAWRKHIERIYKWQQIGS